ncbi:MAG TPA: AI-2E family transporter [Solirubrobacteraceae bacterium]|jgi:predicted PurR-regulated permease PerM|nr:AI-2E family transporter [Solirubrobacteraceae bacterium]
MKLRLSRPRWSPRRRDAAVQPQHELDADAGTPEGEPLSEMGRPGVPPAVVPRWVQMVVLPLALLALYELARAIGSILIVLIIASLVALMLNPFVKRLERGLPRGLAIPLVYLGFFAGVGAIGVALSGPVSTQITHFSNQVPSIVKNANHELDQLQRFLNRNGIKVKIEHQGQTALQTLQKNVLKSSGSILSFSRDLLSKVVTISIDLVLILVLSIYFLVYARNIGDLVRRIMPPGDGTPEDDFPILVQRAVSSYVRGQVLFSLIMGASAGVALWIFGELGIFPDGSRYTLFFGAFYGLMEFIPYVGPIIGPAPAVLVALFDHPISAVWLVLLFIALQQLEGHFVAPQLFRISLRINPILIILALLIGYKLYGIAGSLIALPSAAVMRATVVYLRHHLVLESWSGGGGVGVGVMPISPDRCPECGTVPAGADAYCRTCGASLTPHVHARD